MAEYGLPWEIDGRIDQDRLCYRCGGIIPAHWRHYWRPCSCTYLSASGEPQRPHAPDPACGACDGTGFLPCEPQDLSILRRSGVCETCGASAFVLVRAVGDVGDIEGSAHHFDPQDDEHEVVVVGGSLVKTLTDHLERNTPR